jgi:hypothetical protein
MSVSREGESTNDVRLSLEGMTLTERYISSEVKVEPGLLDLVPGDSARSFRTEGLATRGGDGNVLSRLLMLTPRGFRPTDFE